MVAMGKNLGTKLPGQFTQKLFPGQAWLPTVVVCRVLAPVWPSGSSIA